MPDYDVALYFLEFTTLPLLIGRVDFSSCPPSYNDTQGVTKAMLRGELFENSGENYFWMEERFFICAFEVKTFRNVLLLCKKLFSKSIKV